ncbi:MAG TPA: histidine phosphatase family protein [Verrucomicrobiae bacterium]|nr:histidine phosphatase family protein [Verrucomicrobiae bacterium]
MSLFYLIRHGEHDWLKKGIAGRIAGVRLNANGKQQAENLATRLAAVNFDAIISSPMERAVETAKPLARAKAMELEIAPEITELDFGEWNGATFDKLNADPRWATWNQYRSITRMPGGELMSEVQGRVVRFLESLHARNANGPFALFSHGDSIRAAICYWTATPLDLLPRFEIDPASISILRIGPEGPRVVALNMMA